MPLTFVYLLNGMDKDNTKMTSEDGRILKRVQDDEILITNKAEVLDLHER